jgi:hypothetical protein
MKSALERAMEKADALANDDQANIKLDPEQIQAIEDTKKLYESKWAEQEIMLKGKIAKLSQETDPQTMAEHQGQFAQEMRQVRDRLFTERDAKIEAIRRGEE